MFDVFLRHPKAIIFSVLVHAVLLGFIAIEIINEPKAIVPQAQDKVSTIKAKVIDVIGLEKQKELKKKQTANDKKKRDDARKKVEKKKKELDKKAKAKKKKDEKKLAEKKKAEKKKAEKKKQLIVKQKAEKALATKKKAEKKKAEKRAEEQRLKKAAEKRRKEQERLKAEELKRKMAAADAAEKEKLEKERLEAAKQKKEAEKKRLALEKKKKDDIRIAAEKDQKRKEMELQAQIAAEERQRTLNDFKLQYLSAIQQKIQRNWRQPVNAGKMPNCEVNVLQGPGGVILDVTFGSCPGTTNYRLSVENAVYKSEPLPEPKDTSLFDRDVKILFKPKN